MIPVLPAGWTTDDIQFLIEKVKSWPIVLVDDQSLGIPTTQSIPSEAISDWGYGVLKADTEEYTVLYEINRTPSGKGWAHVDVVSGCFPYEKAVVLERLLCLVETRAEIAAGNETTLVPKLVELVEPEELPVPETLNAPMAPEDKKPVTQTLTFLEEGKRLIAFNEIWMSICCCSVDRGTGEIKYGQWRMYHTNFLGILDPVTGQQVFGPDIWTVMMRTGEIYGVKVELEGTPDWIMPALPALSVPSTPPP
jgi:hypothetical protein